MTQRAIGPEPKRIAVGERQRRVYMEGRAFAVAAAEWLPVLRRASKRLTRGEPYLEDDLVQEALMELWARDVTRFDGADRKVLRNALFERMRFERLKERMERGGENRVAGDVEELVGEELGEMSEGMRRVVEEVEGEAWE